MAFMTVPQSLEAESAVLGAMLLSRSAATEATALLAAADFYEPKHAALFTTIAAQLDANAPTDPLAILTAMPDRLRSAYGAPWLSELTEPANPASVMHFARIVQGKSLLRRMSDAGLRAASIASNAEIADVAADEIEKLIYEATARPSTRDRGVSAGEAMRRSLQRGIDVREGRVKRGIPTGFADLDRLTGGIKPGQLWVPAGRPAMGKSTLGQGLAVACASNGRPAVIASNEMTAIDMGNRLIADLADVNISQVETGRYRDGEEDRVRDAQRMVADWPLLMLDSVWTMPGMRSAIRRYRAEQGDLGIFVIDFLQRVVPTSSELALRRDLQVGGWADQAKNLALELECAGVACSQLNRGSESRPDKVPTLADLRESGQIEQAADIVILIHRPDYYDRESPRTGEADFIVAKHRNGPTDTVTVAAQLSRSRFIDLAAV